MKKAIPIAAVGIGIDGGEVGFALRASPSHSGDKGNEGVNTTLVAIGFDEAQITSEANRTIVEPGLPASTMSKDSRMMVAHPLKAEGADASEDGTGRGVPIVLEITNPITANPYADTEGREDKLIPETCASVTAKWAKSSGGPSGDECQNLTIAFPARMSGTQCAKSEEVSSAIGAVNPGVIQRAAETAAVPGMAVRRLTPRECERLQGFPDDYTLVEFNGKPACDGPRYKAIGNSMAVPVIEWIGRRMELVEELVPYEPEGRRQKSEG